LCHSKNKVLNEDSNDTEYVYYQVLERNPTGQWRGFILQEDLTTRMGYFPSTHVQLNTTSEICDDLK
jgi:hypothetical protein